MSNFLREHRRSILVAMVIFIGIPFAFFVPGFNSLGSGPDGSTIPEVVAQVGNQPISSAIFRAEYDRISRARSQGGIFPTARELYEDGTVERILETLENDSLFSMQAEQLGLSATQDYLEEMLKELPQFRTEAGEFDARYYNQWVSGNAQANWKSIYEEMNRTLNRQIYGSLITAPTRVFDEDLRKKFLDKNTTIKIRHAAIAPVVKLTDEEIRTHYDENLTRYMTEEKRVAEFVAISLDMELSDDVDDIIARAHSGEDFKKLVREFSEGPRKAGGGDLGWVKEISALPDHQRPIFEMSVSDISNPIKGPNGYHIYKVMEERKSTMAGRRDLRVSQIVLRPQLDDAEKTHRTEQAQAIADALTENGGDFAAATEGQNLDVARTEPFSQSTTSIENVDPVDTFVFRRDVGILAADATSGVIEARNNLYVAKVVSIEEPVQRPFEEVAERAETVAIATYKQTPEYAEAVDQYIIDIEEKATSLDQIAELFPELELDPLETATAFNREEFLFQQGIRFQAGDAFDALEGLEPGVAAGPVRDFTQAAYFIELVERNEPDETAWDEQWPTARETLFGSAKLSQQFERQQDYFQFLRERAVENGMIMEDRAAIAQVIGYNVDEVEEAPGSITELESSEAIDATIDEVLDALEISIGTDEAEEAPDATEETSTDAEATEDATTESEE